MTLHLLPSPMALHIAPPSSRVIQRRPRPLRIVTLPSMIRIGLANVVLVCGVTWSTRRMMLLRVCLVPFVAHLAGLLTYRTQQDPLRLAQSAKRPTVI